MTSVRVNSLLTFQISYTPFCRTFPEMVIFGCPGACVSRVPALLKELINRPVFNRKTQKHHLFALNSSSK